MVLPCCSGSTGLKPSLHHNRDNNLVFWLLEPFDSLVLRPQLTVADYSLTPWSVPVHVVEQNHRLQGHHRSLQSIRHSCSHFSNNARTNSLIKASTQHLRVWTSPCSMLYKSAMVQEPWMEAEKHPPTYCHRPQRYSYLVSQTVVRSA